jgi:hypothetical protein
VLLRRIGDCLVRRVLSLAVSRMRCVAGGIGREPDEGSCRFPLPLIRFHFQGARDFSGNRAAKACAQRAADKSAERLAGDGKKLLGRAFEQAAECVSGCRSEDAAGRFRDAGNEIAEEVLEFFLGGDLQQFGGKLHLLGFAQGRTFRGPWVPGVVLIAAKLRPIDVMHCALSCVV